MLGNLKHKSIRGQEISSQMPVTSSDDSVATDEEESSEKSGEELEMVNDVFARYWLEKTRVTGYTLFYSCSCIFQSFLISTLYTSCNL